MDQSHQSKDRVAKLLQTRFLQETYFSFKDTHRLTVKGLKKIVHTNGNQKRVEVASLISDNIDFK